MAAEPQPNIIIAKDGTGNFSSITEAVAAIPSTFQGRFIIYLKTGIYNETILLKTDNVSLIGDGKGKTVIRSSLNAVDGYSIKESGALRVIANNFLAKDITFENLSGSSKGQAVALQSEGNRSAFYGCEIIGYQDTLLVDGGNQFFRECDVYGTVDFIFGNATFVLQKCNIFVRGSGCITAHAREHPSEPTGISIDNCTIKAAADFNPENGKPFLGRPWRVSSRVVIMQSFIDDVIHPQGWQDWDGRIKTADFMEVNNNGPGSVDCHTSNNRIKYCKISCDMNEAKAYSVGQFINGNEWLPDLNVPFDL